MPDSLSQIIKYVSIILAVALFVKLLEFWKTFLQEKKAYKLNSYSFSRKQYFFSYSELELYRMLSEFLAKKYPGKYDVFPKVRLLDLADTKYKNNFYKIAQKHVDFLIVDQTKHCTPIVGIELNGNSHDTEEMKERDEFVGEFFEIIQIPLLTIQNDDVKNVDSVIGKINEFLK